MAETQTTDSKSNTLAGQSSQRGLAPADSLSVVVNQSNMTKGKTTIANGVVAKVVGIAHLAPAVAVCSDEQRGHPLCGELLWRRCPHARRVKPVRFWQASHAPVVFGLPT